MNISGSLLLDEYKTGTIAFSIINIFTKSMMVKLRYFQDIGKFDLAWSLAYLPTLVYSSSRL